MQETRQIHLEAGTPIISLDGKKIGTVKEVRENFVKVDAPRRRDYWLACDQVLSADTNQALLVIPSDEINVYKMDRPGHESLGRLGGDPDVVAQRQRFDRELFGR
ncbi:MAG: hypothetical protein IT303_03750 [Dehalococcoidia bacterium]|nr:hypothetical protein [Dehalococcoidia bacterium]